MASGNLRPTLCRSHWVRMRDRKTQRMRNRDFAMTFTEIARAEGISKSEAAATFWDGMRKLVAMKQSLAPALELAREQEDRRSARLQGDPWQS